MNINKWLVGIGILVVVAGVVYWNTKPTPATGGTIKVGVISPLTGALAQYGEANKNGFVLAANDFNAANKNIQFIYEDSGYDTAKAVSAFRKLTTIDHVNLVIDWGSATSYGIAPLAKSAGVPFIAISVDPDTVKASDYVFRDNPSPDDIANKLWEYFREKHYKKVAMVNLKLLYFDKITEALTRLKQGDETVTIVDTYQSFGDTDFRTSITKIKAAGAYDVLGVFLAGGQIAQFYKQASIQGLSLPTFGTDFFESYSEIAAAGGLMDGAVYAHMGTSDAFVKEYKTRFGDDNQISYAGLAYDLGGLLTKKVDFSTPTSILSSLHSIKEYQGTVGKYTYSDKNGDRYLRPTLYIKQIHGNAITVIE